MNSHVIDAREARVNWMRQADQRLRDCYRPPLVDQGRWVVTVMLLTGTSKVEQNEYATCWQALESIQTRLALASLHWLTLNTTLLNAGDIVCWSGVAWTGNDFLPQHIPQYVVTLMGTPVFDWAIVNNGDEP